MIPAAGAGSAGTLRSNARSTAPFPENPWVGTSQRLLIELLGPPPIPDGPPPGEKELRVLEARWLAHVRGGYRAVYDDSTAGGAVDVRALAFDDEGIPATGWPGRAERRVGNIAVIIRSTAGAETACYRAIDAHIRALR
ncbi:MAG: hypothetical protein R2752_21565 [Vicinamibacterales bacterium]